MSRSWWNGLNLGQKVGLVLVVVAAIAMQVAFMVVRTEAEPGGQGMGEVVAVVAARGTHKYRGSGTGLLLEFTVKFEPLLFHAGLQNQI